MSCLFLSSASMLTLWFIHTCIYCDIKLNLSCQNWLPASALSRRDRLYSWLISRQTGWWWLYANNRLTYRRRYIKPPGGDADWLFGALWLLLLCEETSRTTATLRLQAVPLQSLKAEETLQTLGWKCGSAAEGVRWVLSVARGNFIRVSWRKL